MSKPPGSQSSRPSTSATEAGEKPLHPEVSPSHIPESVRAVWDFIRPQPWVTNNIRKRKSQIILFRCWLAAWAVLILLLSNKSLRTIGNLCVQSTFFVGALLCAYRINTSAVLISGCSSLCSYLLVIRCKFTSMYVPFFKSRQPVLHNLAALQIVVQSLSGLLAGWGIGAAAMKAALAVRSELVAESTLQKAANKSVVSRVALSPLFFLNPKSAFKAL